MSWTGSLDIEYIEYIEKVRQQYARLLLVSQASARYLPELEPIDNGLHEVSVQAGYALTRLIGAVYDEVYEVYPYVVKDLSINRVLLGAGILYKDNHEYLDNNDIRDLCLVYGVDPSLDNRVYVVKQLQSLLFKEIVLQEPKLSYYYDGINLLDELSKAT